MKLVNTPIGIAENDLEHWLFACHQNQEAFSYLISEMIKLNTLLINSMSIHQMRIIMMYFYVIR